MLKIMMIDQDVHQLREISDVLGNGYRLLTCSKGAKAFDLFMAFQPDAVILDPSTEGLNAQEFMAQVRGLSTGFTVPILLLTRFTTIRSIEKILDWGADFIFSKPFRPGDLKDKLAECLSKSAKFPNPFLAFS